MGKKEISDTAIFYGDKPNKGDYDNGVWMDILQIPYIQRLEEASVYDKVIRTLWLDAIGWTKQIRDTYPHVIQIGLSDHPLSTHISKLDAARQYAYLADLQFLDGLMALTEEEREFYQTALPHRTRRTFARRRCRTSSSPCGSCPSRSPWRAVSSWTTLSSSARSPPCRG